MHFSLIVVPAPVENHQLSLESDSTLRSTWTAPHGNYDLMHYIVNIYLNNHPVINMTTKNPYVVYTPPQSGEVRVTVSVMTKCGQVGMSSSSNTIANIVNNKGAVSFVNVSAGVQT